MELLPQQIEWLEALESGKYKQGRVHLRTKDDEFCCLGVACEIAVKANIIPPAGSKLGLIILHYAYGNDESEYYHLIPEVVRKYFNLKDSGMRNLVNYNDKLKLSFKEIAAKIREEPENFFSN